MAGMFDRGRHSVKSTTSLSKLSNADIDALTNILSRPITCNFSAHGRNNDENTLLTHRQDVVAGLIASLPKHLLRSSSSSSSSRAGTWHASIMAFLARRKRDGRAAAPLCKIHKSLNAYLVRSIFSAHVAEVGLRLERLMQYMACSSSDSKLAPSIAALVTRLGAIHALWTPAAIYRQWFGMAPDPKWSFQADGCEACILARIGGDAGAVMDLRVAAGSRRGREKETSQHRRRRSTPRLVRWTDAIIERNDRFGDVRRRIEDEAKRLRNARRAARKELRGESTTSETKEPLRRDRTTREEGCTSIGRSSSSKSHSNTTQASTRRAITRKAGEDDDRDTNDSLDSNDSDEDDDAFEEKIIDYYAALATVNTLPRRTDSSSSSSPASRSTRDLHPGHLRDEQGSARFSSQTALVVDGVVHPAARHDQARKSTHGRQRDARTPHSSRTAVPDSRKEGDRSASNRAREYRNLLSPVRTARFETITSENRHPSSRHRSRDGVRQ